MPRSLQPSPVFRPTGTLEERASVHLARLAAAMQHDVEQALKPFGLTFIQYNALRILNGAGPDGLCGIDLARRLISKAPDVPRLLDRLAEAGLVGRERDPENRRFIRAHITPEGVERLIDSAPTVAALHQHHWRTLTREQLEVFFAVLDRLDPTDRPA